MTRIPDERDTADEPPAAASCQSSDLKFVPLTVDDELGGGWYRELPDAQIEVMSRAQLERVPLDNAEPEEKARTIVEQMLKRAHG
jgi:hypothetical protein